MKRFFIERIEEGREKVSITGQEARHIHKVLRMRPGDELIIMDNDGKRFQAVIEISGSREIVVKLGEKLPTPAESPVIIILNQSLLKSRNMDLIIQKTSELGVNRICPFISTRTVVNIDEKRFSNRLSHWRNIAGSSAGQSGRIKPAEIDSLHSFTELIEDWRDKDACKLILWEDEKARDIKTVLRKLSPVKTFTGVVGPEGGFSREEIDMAKNAGFIPVTLGQRILRAETAAIAVTAIVQYECGDLCLNQNGDL